MYITMKNIESRVKNLLENNSLKELFKDSIFHDDGQAYYLNESDWQGTLCFEYDQGEVINPVLWIGETEFKIKDTSLIEKFCQECEDELRDERAEYKSKKETEDMINHNFLKM